MKIQAAVATAAGVPLEMRDLELDTPHADEVTVQMVASGVCHTDAIVRDQWYPVPLPAVLGHEGSGIVTAVGADVTDLAVGDKVVLAPASCGVCELCLTGRPQYCVDFYPLNFGGTRTDGSTTLSDNGEKVSSNFFGQSSFATYANVRARNAVKVDADAPIELLGPLGCGIMTGSGAVLNVLKPSPGESVAVFGTGAVGLSGMLAAVASGATTIIMVDIVQERLEFALELGATHIINSREVDAVEKIREITGGRGVNYALDTTGVPQVFAQMTRSLAIKGHGVLVGAAKLGTEAPFEIGSLLQSGITISLVIEGDAVPREFIPKLIALHKRGLFPFDKLVKTYDFADINQAFDDSESGKTIKPVLIF